jgi:hypothetical protein
MKQRSNHRDTASRSPFFCARIEQRSSLSTRAVFLSCVSLDGVQNALGPLKSGAGKLGRYWSSAD